MGENGAGKSTLMKCLFGIYKPDGGEILLNGEVVSIQSSKDALASGISMIHQELHPVPHRNVMENIWLGRFPLKGIGPLKLWITRRCVKIQRVCSKSLIWILSRIPLVGTLSVSKVQSIEIAKAVSFNSKVIVMDEPTSSLTGNEVEQLFRIISELRVVAFRLSIFRTKWKRFSDFR